MAKNLHLEHLEDEILNTGFVGARGSILFLIELHKMLNGNAKGSYNMTVKWDGAPAIFAGTHPETGEFIIAKKSLFNANPKFYRSVPEINSATDLSDGLKKKFVPSFMYLKDTMPKGAIYQGDLLFTDDISVQNMDGVKSFTFTPNTITYSVPVDSDVGREIKAAKVGIVWHTKYTGSELENMSASFGVNISQFKKSKYVWAQDATYKDVSGSSTMPAKLSLQVRNALSNAGKAFKQIKAKDINNFLKIQNTVTAKGASGGSYKTYVNSIVRERRFNPTAQEYINYVEQYWADKVVAPLKTEKTRAIKEQIGKDLIRDLKYLRGTIDTIAAFQKHMVDGKDAIIKHLNKLKSIGTFLRTPNGYKVTEPEGYVAIDRKGSAVKLVDRLEFSFNNFTARKDWDK